MARVRHAQSASPTHPPRVNHSLRRRDGGLEVCCVMVISWRLGVIDVRPPLWWAEHTTAPAPRGTHATRASRSIIVRHRPDTWVIRPTARPEINDLPGRVRQRVERALEWLHPAGLPPSRPGTHHPGL